MENLKEPIHKLCDIIIDGYEIPFSFSPSTLQEAFTVVQTELNKILKPHLSTQRMQQLDELFKLLGNEDLEYDFFTRKKWRETKEVGTILRELWDAQIV